MPTRSRKPSGFTLIEVLMVIAIIGVLVGLLIPAVMMGLNTVKRNAIAMEVTTIAKAVDEYKLKFNDYPPDGSNASTLTRHLRKAFPQIASSEIALLTTDNFPGTSIPIVNFSNGSPTGVMDAPEALVFFLGGFSSDPVYPFSGVGGPFFIMNDETPSKQVTSDWPKAGRSSVQYNPDRNEPLFEFKQSQLTMDVIGGQTQSTDENLYFGGTNDAIPVYHPSGRMAPIVYFDGRSYFSGGFYNFYGSASASFGVTRPYRSDSIRTTASSFETQYRYMNEDSFQVQSAGLDDLFGQIPFTAGTGGGPIFFAFPSGQSINFAPSPGSAPTIAEYTGFKDPNGVGAQLDNATNFSEGILGNSLKN